MTSRSECDYREERVSQHYFKEVRMLLSAAVTAELTMSVNMNRRRAAGRERGGRGQGCGPPKKGFVSTHSNDAMKKATLDMGYIANATHFVKWIKLFPQ